MPENKYEGKDFFTDPFDKLWVQLSTIHEDVLNVKESVQELHDIVVVGGLVKAACRWVVFAMVGLGGGLVLLRSVYDYFFANTW